MKIAIIPARGGSKRIPRKNIRPFCDKPIIARSIEAAIESELFDHVIVSTDCQEIAEIARSYGAETPFVRPTELSSDVATTRVVVNHTINWVNDNLGEVDYACCLYATAPFVTAEAIRQSFAQLLDVGSDFCFTVTSFPSPIQRALFMDDSGQVEMFSPEHLQSRSQDLIAAYHDAGQFYWGKAEAFLRGDIMYSSHATPYIVPRYQVQDIDTEEDWVFAERIFVAGRM
ncbi:pseudaminic acid cytidylyltransferase [Shewanella saliphila]|uniref:Pseudaminic acid cytidylyltransferase n=1 Tax=Shewanella saliphila TaxID=2282698 RepID=A0ABQ2Q2W3_9GAMM|nr:pseudaminic acid cytidylyltransferase [Shewanella saliphila]MCL1099815.1 pseudaminic acid cytidylyltransferase [Shewanella saliphila]GGP44994.1 pseudaminic acid cytidylyltransferase [Shewanella saliphila]